MNSKIVILNWNGRLHLERFLPSVVKYTTEAQIVVVDNGSVDDSVEFLRATYPQIELLILDQNYGYAEGYNRALNMLEAEFFVLLNSDIDVVDGWLEPLIQCIKSDDQIMAVAPKILSVESPHKFEYAGAAGGFIDGFGYPFCRGRILNSIEIDNGQYDDAREVFWASGACMLVRSSIFKQLGGFDADFFAHMEEIDLCWRAQLAGYKIMVEPKSYIYHLGGGTLPNNSPRKLYLNYRNNLSMLFKNLSARSFLPVLFVRMILDGVSACVFMLQGRVDLFKVVFRAHVDFHKIRPSLRVKRAKIQENRVTTHTKNIYKYGIILRYMLGKRTFSDLM